MFIKQKIIRIVNGNELILTPDSKANNKNNKITLGTMK